MRTDEQLLEELNGFAHRFINQYNIFGYDNGGFVDGLGDYDLNNDDWKNSTDLRREFKQWVVDNGLDLPKTNLAISFDPPKLALFGLIKEIGE